MQMYAVVNVENLKLYEPPLIDDQGEHVQIPSIDDFSPEYLTELHEDTILDRRMRTSKRGNVEYLRVGDQGIKFCSKIQSARNRFKTDESVGLVIANPTQLISSQTGRREREILQSVHKVKQAKKGR
jgi:hypothetical protein